MDLFDFTKNASANAPLADRMRPRNLDEFIGQEHIVGKNSLLSRAIRADKLGSCIFYGPPGTGKTTLASIVAAETKGVFEKLNAVSSGVADAKRIIDEAEKRRKMYGTKTYLLLDECHRWNKAQSDSVLAAIENGNIVFIGSTTENPFFSMTRAIVSRCRVFELKPLADADVIKGLKCAVSDSVRGLGSMNVTVDEDAYAAIAWGAGGDLRNALNGLELAVLTTPPDSGGGIRIDKQTALQSVQKRVLSIDETQYYDMLSAFCKSLRGSDANAALYWAFALVQSGCDPLIILRRMITHASEDVGLADSSALTVAVNACLAYERLGQTEGLIPMAHAIIHICSSPKSCSVVKAISAVKAVLENGADYSVPPHLLNRESPHMNRQQPLYKYPHDYGGYVEQQYMPDSLKNEKFYFPSGNGEEKKIAEFLKNKGF